MEAKGEPILLRPCLSSGSASGSKAQESFSWGAIEKIPPNNCVLFEILRFSLINIVRNHNPFNGGFLP